MNFVTELSLGQYVEGNKSWLKIIDNACIFHPFEEINLQKILRYSFGQKKLIKNLNFPHSIIFFLII